MTTLSRRCINVITVPFSQVRPLPLRPFPLRPSSHYALSLHCASPITPPPLITPLPLNLSPFCTPFHYAYPMKKQKKRSEVTIHESDQLLYMYMTENGITCKGTWLLHTREDGNGLSFVLAKYETWIADIQLRILKWIHSYGLIFLRTLRGTLLV